MSQILHDDYATATPLQRIAADAARARRARMAARVFVPIKRVEIREEPTETTIEVTACNGQIVLVTERAVAEAKARYERIGPGDGSRVSIEKIQRAVCKYFEVSRADLISDSRKYKFVLPRQVGFYLAKTLTLKSLPEIGRRFGGRDHTTVLHGYRKIEADITIKTTLAEQVAKIKANIEEASS